MTLIKRVPSFYDSRLRIAVRNKLKLSSPSPSPSPYSVKAPDETMCEIKTFVFFDCETTGLPYLENNRTKITELCFAGVESAHVSIGVYPRVLNKLVLCFNPQKLISSEAEKITGLSNEILQYQAVFSADTVELLKSFLAQFEKPICFVAHNGDRFDYPILRNQIEKTGVTLPEDILCIDSLNAFKDLHYEDTDETDASNQIEAEPQLRVQPAQNGSSVVLIEQLETTKTRTSVDVPMELLDGYDELLVSAIMDFEEAGEGPTEINLQKVNETTPPGRVAACKTPNAPVKKPVGCTSASTSRSIRFRRPVSFKLCDVYKRLTCSEPEDVHEAEGDVKLLIHCAANLGDRFLRWANTHFKYFKNIPAMSPHKKIGT